MTACIGCGCQDDEACEGGCYWVAKAPSELAGELYGNRWRVGISPLVSNNFPQVAEAPWAPQRVIIRVQAPSGAVFSLETVRLAQRARP